MKFLNQNWMAAVRHILLTHARFRSKHANREYSLLSFFCPHFRVSTAARYPNNNLDLRHRLKVADCFPNYDWPCERKHRLAMRALLEWSWSDLFFSGEAHSLSIWMRCVEIFGCLSKRERWARKKKYSKTKKTKKKRVSTFIIYGPSEMENAEFCFCFHLPVDIPNSWAHFAIEPTWWAVLFWPMQSFSGTEAVSPIVA